jgi:uncharacterized membrane protein
MILTGHIILAATFLGLSLIFRVKQPQNINYLYGYRTSFSMKNIETWREANIFSSNLMFKFAIAFIVFEVISYFLIGAKDSFTVSAICLTTLSVAVIPFTEIHLRRKFDKNGQPRING